MALTLNDQTQVCGGRKGNTAPVATPTGTTSECLESTTAYDKDVSRDAFDQAAASIAVFHNISVIDNAFIDVASEAQVASANLQHHKEQKNKSAANERKTRDVKPSLRPVECVLCHKTMAHACQLAAHMRTHTGEKPYRCQDCKKTFATSGNLAGHWLRNHSNPKYHCDKCSKKFYFNSELERHKNVHADERQIYVCDLCGVELATDCGLLIHRRTHSSDKPYICDECGKAFGDSSTYGRHKRIHTGVKPYRCHICQCSFAQNGVLKNHILTHTGERSHFCHFPGCGQSFARKNYARAHEKKYHRLRNEEYSS